jgi:hypothetical protein
MAGKKKDFTSAAAAATSKLFSSAEDQNSKREVIQKPKEENPQKSAKKVFSFRGGIDSVTKWRLYADASGMKVDDLGTAALEEYLENHPLTEEQKQIYDIKLKRKKA